MAKPAAVLLLDNTSMDNQALALAATRPSSLVDVKAIFVTGRAAHTNLLASIEDRDDGYSEQIQLLNAKRMTGFLRRAGRETKVYTGLDVGKTQLRTVIPHKFHVDEHIYDLEGDCDKTAVTGNFESGLECLRSISSDLILLVGGPLTEVSYILDNCPEIAAKFSTMVVQAGDFGDNDSNLLGGKGNSFNGACDAYALHKVLFEYAGEIYILPSNITKSPDIGFKTPDKIAALGVNSELARGYRVHYEHSAKRRGTSLFIHDLGLVMLIEQIMQQTLEYPYRYEPVDILEVPYLAPKDDQPERRGTIVIGPYVKNDACKRFVVVWQDIGNYCNRVAKLLVD